MEEKKAQNRGALMTSDLIKYLARQFNLLGGKTPHSITLFNELSKEEKQQSLL